jgi:sortase A
MRNHPISNWRRRIANLLVIAGAIAIGICAWSILRLTLFQQREDAALDSTDSTFPQSHGARRQKKARNGDPLARLMIPRLHMRAIVCEGDDDHTLDVALGHIPGTALPGQRGNVGVAGHRDALFRDLRYVQKDDLIQLQTPSATYDYRVDDMAIVKPETVSVLRPHGGSDLTLVTCYPFQYVGSAPERYVVEARLVSQGPAHNASPRQ